MVDQTTQFAAQSRRFLEALFNAKPPGLYILLWTLPEKESRWCSTLSEAIDYASQFQDRDLYVGVGVSKQEFGAFLRCRAEQVAGIFGLWADLDLRSTAHLKGTLPSTVEDALSILPREFPPSMVVLTGNGVHVWWLFREPWIFECESDRQAAANLSYRFQTFLAGNASQRGWTFDRLADLARVLRVPGTTNCKDRQNPKPVTLQSETERRYNPSDFNDYLDRMGIPEETARKTPAANAPSSAASINLNAQIPGDVLKGWLGEDPRFRETWFRHRSDLRDQSQSGYDMALANFGVRRALPEQQIIDLIVHHRAIHKAKSRTTLDYFFRTIAKASEANTMPRPIEQREKSSEGGDFSPDVTPEDSIQAKAAICRRLSEAFGIEILRMIKISGKQPIYRMETARGKIQFDQVGKLISQHGARIGIAAITGQLIPSFKPMAWREIAQAMLDACIVEEGGEELEAEGSARLCLDQYLSETGSISSIEGCSTQDIRKPMIKDGQITVCSGDIQLYINRTGQPGVTVQAVVAMLSAIDAKAVRVRGSKFKEQSRWLLPLSEFNPNDYFPEAEIQTREPEDQNG